MFQASTRSAALRGPHLTRDANSTMPSLSAAIHASIVGAELLVSEAFRSCCLSGSAGPALSMLKSLTEPSTPLQNTIVRRLCDHGLFDLALDVHNTCRASGCTPDGYTFPPVLKACSALKDVRSGTRAHASLLKTCFDRNDVVQTALLYFYGMTGRVETAHALLYLIADPDAVSWNALISSYSSELNLGGALELFQEMRATGTKPTVGTLASILPLCTQLARADLGRFLHGLALKSGLLADGTLTPALISMYSCAGCLHASSVLFEASGRADIPTWNAVIFAFVRNHDPNGAVLRFRQMLRDDLRPDALTLVSILPSLAGHSGEAVHAFAVKLGFDARVSISTALLSMYGKSGDVNSSSAVFCAMPDKNVISWNSMLSAYAHAGFWEAALAVFEEMQLSGPTPDAVSLITVLPACSESGDVLLGRSVHGFGIRHGLNSRPDMSNALSAFYFANRRSEAVSVFRRMCREGTRADPATLTALLPACDCYMNLLRGMAVHGYALRVGFGFEVSLSNAFVSMYVCCGDFLAAETLFAGMEERDTVSWNALLTGYRRHGMDVEAITLFRRMLGGTHHDPLPDYVTLLIILPACRTRSQGGSVHAYSVRMGTVAETHLATALIVMYARFGRISSCRALSPAGRGIVSPSGTP